MKRILFFIESLSGGGAEKVLVTLLKYIDFTKYDLTLLALVDMGVLKNDINFNKIHYGAIIHPSNNCIIKTWNKIKYKIVYSYMSCRWINKFLIPQEGFDIYVALTEGFATKLIAFSPGKKIAWVHIDLKKFPWTHEEGIYTDMQEEITTYCQYDKVVCVSHSVEEVMKDYFSLQNTITIYNPIDSDSILEMSEVPSEITISSSFSIVSVGRLVPQKGYDELIPIIGTLHKTRHNVHLYLVGDGPEIVNLKQIARQQKVEDFVHFMGYVKNPYPLMKQMDLFVCSSRAEGYSLVIAEAIILGLPIISMNCSGPNELLDEGKYGDLCNSYEELAKAIKNAVIDSSYLQELRQKSSARQPFFDIRQTLVQVENLLDNL